MQSKASRGREVLRSAQHVAMVYVGNPAVAALYETPSSGVHVAREGVTVREGKGFLGDHDRKSFWRGAFVPGREVTACSIEVLAHLGVDPRVVGDNLITRGLDLRLLEPGQRIKIGDHVELIRSEREHRPCATFRDRTSVHAFEFVARGYRGALFTVAIGGAIRVGDEIVPVSV